MEGLDSLAVENLSANGGDLRDANLIPGPERFTGGGRAAHSSILDLENPMDRGTCQATYSPKGHKELDITEVKGASQVALVVKNPPTKQEM